VNVLGHQNIGVHPRPMACPRLLQYSLNCLFRAVHRAFCDERAGDWSSYSSRLRVSLFGPFFRRFRRKARSFSVLDAYSLRQMVSAPKRGPLRFNLNRPLHPSGLDRATRPISSKIPVLIMKVLLRSRAKLLNESWGLLFLFFGFEEAIQQSPVIYPNIYGIASESSGQAVRLDPGFSDAPLREDATWKSRTRTIKNPNCLRICQNLTPYLLLKLNHRWIASTALLIVPRLLFTTDCCVDDSSGEPAIGFPFIPILVLSPPPSTCKWAGP